MTRDALTEKIVAAKRKKKLGWKTLAAKIDPKASPIFITAALLGQMCLLPEQAGKEIGRASCRERV